jgi:signal transduction histidine kinase
MERELRFVNGCFAVFADMSKRHETWLLNSGGHDALNRVIDDVHHMVASVSTNVTVVKTTVDPAAYDWQFDPNRLMYTLHALVENAVKAARTSRRDGKRVNSAFRVVEHCVELTVEDNGCGIRPEDRERIFQDGVSLFEPRSSGLGLTIVKALVHGYTGAGISLTSELEVGTRFVVRFPIRAGQELIGI